MGNLINIGTAPNDGTGDTLRNAFNKVNLDKFENVIYVKQPSDFGTVSSDNIYMIATFIDMGTTSINIPDGQDLNITGTGYNSCGLFSTEDNYTMFVGDVAGVGDVFIRGLDLSVSGANSKVGTIKGKTGFEFISHIEVNFSNCTKAWEIESFRQGEEFNTGRFNGTPQMEFIGTWLGGYLIERSLTRFLDDTWTEPLFKAGAGLTFDSRFDSNMNLDLGTNGSYLDFSPSNFTKTELLQLKNGLVTRDGVFETDQSTITPNINETNKESLWRNNTGIANTNKGGVLSITTQAETTITTQNDWVDLAGTFTLTREQHTDSPANGQIRSLDQNPVDYNLTGSVLLNGTANSVIECRINIFRDATSTFEPQDMFRTIISSNLGGTDIGTIFLFDRFTLNENDYIKIEVRNTTGAQNVTAETEASKIKLSAL